MENYQGEESSDNFTANLKIVYLKASLCKFGIVMNRPDKFQKERLFLGQIKDGISTLTGSPLQLEDGPGSLT